MPAHPKDKLGILAMPTASLVVAEKAPSMPVVLVLHKNANPPTSRTIAYVLIRSHVLLPDDAKEEWPRAVHDSNVRELPILVIGFQRFYHEEEEGMGQVRSPWRR
ncbi:hypothetical protein CK516_05575 [Nostoc sp. 'Peltigera malacea cyanobiont' DB3992]|nr:hypothetical protein CK516_05575 [Nostoc sp. 'Peltigera malacea cyanobiont' DB3992]